MPRTFATVISERRDDLGLSQRQIGARMAEAGAPLHENMISRYFTGVSAPEGHNLEALLDALELRGTQRRAAYCARWPHIVTLLGAK